MPDLTLCLAFHCHQPVGNFDHVIEDAFARCYRPMLEVLNEHPDVRFALHWSGILFDWAEQREHETLELLHAMVDRGQIEMLGGGYYEPLLPLLPPQDVAGQLQAQQDYIQRRFGQTPAGFWLTERVWEPQLPRLVAPTGLRYTMADDTHFRAAGLAPDTLRGYFLTEDNGETLAVFPVDKTLRYSLPFREPHESIDRLREVAERYPGSAVTYGDDGEKFGLWPGTYDWIYEQRYLHRFCEALEAESEWLTLAGPEQYRAAQAPTGRIYLPTATYDEMESWVLDAEDQLTYEHLMHAELPDHERRFLRGGYFRNFLRKYPEANLMHKRMLETSRRIANLGRDATDEMRHELWQGQCSCPYWHGLFGGLYLNGIRQAIHAHCIRGGALADAKTHQDTPWVETSTDDFDCDGQQEIIVRGSALEAWIKPEDGGTVALLDDRQSARMLSDVLMRAPEAYHQKIASIHDHQGDDAPKSIHDQIAVKEEGLSDLLIYDSDTRACFRDRVLSPQDSLDAAVAASLSDEGGWAKASYTPTTTVVGHQAKLEMTASGRACGGHPELTIQKIIEYDDAEAKLSAAYRHKSTGLDATIRFSTECNFTLLSPDAPNRHLDLLRGEACIRASFGDTAEVHDCTGFRLIDEWAGMTLVVQTATPATLWRYPVETVSNSESGFERTYQGSCFLFVWDWALSQQQGPAITMRLETNA